ncbi:hypothetical protein HDU77_003550 [Chytriomyces hyalinus]|nr:hypothetical protein HDU77_003550 [Chytriomyces hyalinus]
MATAAQTEALALLNGAFQILAPCVQNCFIASGISFPVTWAAVYDSCNTKAKKDAIDACVPLCKDPLGPTALGAASKSCLAFAPAFSPGAVASSSAAPTSAATTGAPTASESSAAPAESTTDSAAASEAPVATEKPDYNAPAATMPAAAGNLYSSASAVVGSIAAVFAAAALC